MTKGYKTSEFWVGVVTSITTLVNQSGALGSFTLPIESLAVIAGLAVTYILSRGVSKINA